ncbi:MAG: putative manganese-dependent inorganic diphosphatase [Gemmatimonadales bacterium]|nr:MAG: putative manganese-dependent inorganic diphosphatase [Gemmatimonadales bacterium]
MPRPILIFGHRNPDADAICSALAYADYKSQTAEGEFKAARCGNSNARIDAILNHFGVALPPFIGDVTPRLRDTMSPDPITVHPEATCANALKIIEENDFQVVPVVDEASGLLGQVSVFQLGRYFLPRPGRVGDMRRVRTSIASVVDALGARILHVEDADRVQDFHVRVGAMDIRSFDRIRSDEYVAPEQSVVVVGDRWDIQQRSIQLGIRLLVITGAMEVEADVVERAREAGVSLIVSPFDSATTAWTIRVAARVSDVMTDDLAEFSPEETVADVRRRTATMGPAVFMVTNDEGRLVGVFTRRDLLRPSSTRIILVDHNELTQAVSGADEVEIIEVVDHHRLGDLRTADPILFLNRPVGSTCTIVADLYQQAGLTPSREMAGVMMGGLVSDTLNLRSPTTTALDKEILGWLEGIAGLTGTELADIIFSSGSVVANHEPAEVIGMDRKTYLEDDFTFAISQVEEVGFEGFWDRTEELLDALEASRVEDELDFAALMVTNIKEQDSLLLVRGSQGVIEAINYPAVEEHEIYRLDGVVSRKKQLLPFITGILKNARE